jgi:DEAD/DEAH box helicase
LVLKEFLKDSPVHFSYQLLIGGSDLDVGIQTREAGLVLLTIIHQLLTYQDTRKFMENGCQIVIGTPGRVEAFMGAMEFSASFKELEVLVLDEADR